MVAVSLNIKSARVHELARRAAELGGTSQTGAVEQALERYLRELEGRRGNGGARVRRALDALDAQLTDEDRRAIRDADLYDDLGLPQ